MSRLSLSDAGDYQLVDDDQDIRGWNVVETNGQPVGQIESLIIDTDAELVTTLVLEDGTEIPARDVTIGETVVYLDRSGSAAGSVAGTTTDAASLAGSGMGGTEMGSATAGSTRPVSGRIARREHVANVNENFGTDFDDDFQQHHETTYGASGRSYDETSAAYRYGYTAAHGDANRNRMYSDAEDDLRAGYTSGDYDADREAVRHGYGRAQRRGR